MFAKEFIGKKLLSKQNRNCISNEICTFCKVCDNQIFLL